MLHLSIVNIFSFLFVLRVNVLRRCAEIVFSVFLADGRADATVSHLSSVRNVLWLNGAS